MFRATIARASATVLPRAASWSCKTQFTKNKALFASAALVAGGVAWSFYSHDMVSLHSDEVRVAGVDDLKDGEMRKVKLNDDTDILLVKTGGKFFATSPKCPHYGAPLEKGLLAGDRVVCPWHDASFALDSGEVQGGPSLDGLLSYPVTIRDNAVFVSPSPLPPRSPTPSGADKTVLIVGGGPASLVAAETLRREGFSGKIVVATKDSEATFVDRPMLSKAVGIPLAKIILRSDDAIKASNISVVKDEVTAIDVEARTATTRGAQTLSFDHVVIAPGSRAVQLPGGSLTGVHTLRSPADSTAIANAVKDPGSKVVVIGASFIGMEAASSIKKNLKAEDVTIVGMEATPMQAVLGEVGSVLGGLQEKNGVKLRMGSRVTAFRSEGGKVTGVELSDGTVLPADVVVLGVGVKPNTSTIKFNGVTTRDDGSLEVDEFLRVRGAKPGVAFAAGDVAAFPYHGSNIRVEHWNAAQDMGRVVGHNIAQPQSQQRFTSVPFFWTMMWGKSLKYVGATPNGYDEILPVNDTDGSLASAFYVKNGRVEAVATFDGVKAAAAGELLAWGEMPPPCIVAKESFDLVEYAKSRAAMRV
mmetsp:Transcript_48683/g.122489  ORF Transcript_48683/g.122489 Transcript_48683/m.122489 type:complete len:586 (+) Transcript_48683:43-1800(+)